MIDYLRFSMFVSHCQIAVFNAALNDTFNDWTQRHVDQGFSWRPGSVSFRTVEDGGNHLVLVETGTPYGEPPSRFVRVIDVPFEVPASGIVTVATVCDRKEVQLPPGSYQLRFECSDASGSDASIRLQFSKQNDPSFRLVRADPILVGSADLLLIASPA